jgi:hypothetical protein
MIWEMQKRKIEGIEKRKNGFNKSQVNWCKCNNAVSKSKMILRRLGGGDEAYMEIR